jgi:hypothetical protein
MGSGRRSLLHLSPRKASTVHLHSSTAGTVATNLITYSTERGTFRLKKALVGGESCIDASGRYFRKFEPARPDD